MPALVNSSVGSSCGTTDELGTNVWPCFCTKKSMYCWRISLDVIKVTCVWWAISTLREIEDYSRDFEHTQADDDLGDPVGHRAHLFGVPDALNSRRRAPRRRIALKHLQHLTRNCLRFRRTQNRSVIEAGQNLDPCARVGRVERALQL